MRARIDLTPDAMITRGTFRRIGSRARPNAFNSDALLPLMLAATRKLIASRQANPSSTRFLISGGKKSGGIDSKIARASRLISSIADDGSVPSSTRRTIKAFAKLIATVDCTIAVTAKALADGSGIESISLSVRPARIARQGCRRKPARIGGAAQ